MTLGNISDNIIIKEYFKDFMFHISISNFHTAKLDASVKIKLPISFVDIPYSYIEVMLNFCQRFYDRQFLTRKLENSDILTRFQNVLKEYYSSGEQLRNGLPTLQYMAEKLCLSPSYLSDLIKRSTGSNASRYIQRMVIQQAKNLMSAGQNISQTAYGLGFDYPQHFSRFFKREEGITPKEYLIRRKTSL